MPIAVHVEPLAEPVPLVEYRWDPDTDILSVTLAGQSDGLRDAGVIELEGTDGSWLVLDVGRGSLAGVEVAVWPEVRMHPGLAPPHPQVDGRLRLAAGGAPVAPGAEVEAPLAAESNEAEEVIYFRVGTSRPVRTVRVGSHLLVDLDKQQRLAGLWLLNVPPFPSTRPAP